MVWRLVLYPCRIRVVNRESRRLSGSWAGLLCCCHPAAGVLLRRIPSVRVGVLLLMNEERDMRRVPRIASQGPYPSHPPNRQRAADSILRRAPRPSRVLSISRTHGAHSRPRTLLYLSPLSHLYCFPHSGIVSYIRPPTRSWWPPRPWTLRSSQTCLCLLKCQPGTSRCL